MRTIKRDIRLLFTVFCVLVPLTIPVTLFADQQAVCPCFTIGDLTLYAPPGPGTQHVEEVWEEGAGALFVSRHAFLTDYELQQGCIVGTCACLGGCAPAPSGSCSEAVVGSYEPVSPAFAFEAAYNPQEEYGMCTGYDTASGFDNKVEQPISAAEAKACLTLLLQKRANDLAPFIGQLRKPLN